MVKIVFLFTFFLTTNIGAQVVPHTDVKCQNLLNWIYKDFTLNNVDLSYKRLMQKLMVSIQHANEYNLKSNKQELNDALNEIMSIDKDFEIFLETPEINQFKDYWIEPSEAKLDYSSKQSKLSSAIQTWVTLQKNNPEFFAEMDKKYLLDEWDNQTVDILNKLETYEFDDHNFKQELELISKELDQANVKILKGGRFDSAGLKSAVMTTNDEIIAALIEAYSDNTNKYASVCPEEELKLYINSENLLCPIPTKESGVEDIQAQLKELQLLISNSDLLRDKNLSEPESDPPIIVKKPLRIFKPDYVRNESEAVNYCKRPVEMATMIVLHHTGVQSNPIEINDAHINNPRNSEPWYMIGYNYIIEDDYMEGTAGYPEVFEGRPIEIKGAHAGGYTSKLTQKEKQFYSQFPISCGNNVKGFTASTLKDQMNSRGGISGNLASIGIAVSGQFTPVKIRTIAGVAIPENINRTRASLPSKQEIQKVADLSCNLQKQYPNLKTFVPHSYFKNTECPAALVLYFEEIQRLAKEQGCDFKIKLKKGAL